jgi:hypothetical protein
MENSAYSEDAQKNAIEKLKKIQEESEKESLSSPYQAVQIRFTDNEGKVKAYAQMYVKDMLNLEKLHGYDRTETVAMLFKAAEEDLIRKIK